MTSNGTLQQWASWDQLFVHTEFYRMCWKKVLKWSWWENCFLIAYLLMQRCVTLSYNIFQAFLSSYCTVCQTGLVNSSRRCYWGGIWSREEIGVGAFKLLMLTVCTSNAVSQKKRRLHKYLINVTAEEFDQLRIICISETAQGPYALWREGLCFA